MEIASLWAIIRIICTVFFSLFSAYSLRSRANLSTVKLQMQRLNCHSQLISNSVQNAHTVQSIWPRVFYALLAAVATNPRCKRERNEEINANAIALGHTLTHRMFFFQLARSISFMKLPFCVALFFLVLCCCVWAALGNLSGAKKWIVHSTSPFFWCATGRRASIRFFGNVANAQQQRTQRD